MAIPTRVLDGAGQLADLDARVSELERLGASRWGVAAPRYGVHIYKSALQSIVQVTVTPVAFDTAVFDAFGFWSGASTVSRVKVPAGGAGLYVARMLTAWDGATSVVGPQLGFHVINAAADNLHHDRGDDPLTTALNQFRNLTSLLELNDGDEVEPWVYHASAAARNLLHNFDANSQHSPFFKMYRMAR